MSFQIIEILNQLTINNIAEYSCCLGGSTKTKQRVLETTSALFLCPYFSEKFIPTDEGRSGSLGGSTKRLKEFTKVCSFFSFERSNRMPFFADILYIVSASAFTLFQIPTSAGIPASRFSFRFLRDCSPG